MRKTCRPQPTITIGRDPTGRGGIFYPTLNSIVLYNSTEGRDDTDDEALYMILHELDHWAQVAYLPYRDAGEASQSSYARGIRHPVIEKHNAFPTASWGYPEAYEEWQKRERVYIE